MANYSVEVLIKAIDKLSAPMKAMGKSVEGLKGPISKVEGSFANLKKTALGMFAPLTIATGLFSAGLGELVEKYSEFAIETEHVAKRLGLSTDSLQEFHFAAKASGMQIESFDKAFQKFTISAGQAITGNKAMIKLYKTLGVHLLDANRHARSGESIFLDLADRLSKITDPLKRNAEAAKIFGVRNLQMLQLISHGRQGILEFKKAAEEMGFVVSESAIKSFTEFKVKTTELSTAMFNLGGNILGSYMPAINKTIDAAIKWIRTHQQLIKTRVKEFFDKAVPAVEKLATILIKLGGELDSVVNKFGGWVNIIQFALIIQLGKLGIAVIQSALAIKELITAFTGLSLVESIALFGIKAVEIAMIGLEILSGPVGWALLGIGLAALVIMKYWKPISAFFQKIWDGIISGVNAVLPYLEKVGNWVSKITGHHPIIIQTQSITTQPIAGKRAMGGSVSGGQSYLVGERGPELFQAHQSGRIFANASLGQRDEIYLHVKIDSEGRPHVAQSRTYGRKTRINYDVGMMTA